MMLAGFCFRRLKGLLYGCGDAVIGVNPASDSVETVLRDSARAWRDWLTRTKCPRRRAAWRMSRRSWRRWSAARRWICCSNRLAERRRANRSFGITLAMLREGRERVLEHHRQRDVPWKGENVMYFETGQGSALSAEAHHGVDQLTLEARAYGVARAFDPFLVNSVVGFIGPEYLVRRAADHSRRARRSFHGQAAGAADGLRCVLHESRGGGPEFGGQSACCCWPRRDAITSWACRARTT